MKISRLQLRYFNDYEYQLMNNSKLCHWRDDLLFKRVFNKRGMDLFVKCHNMVYGIHDIKTTIGIKNEKKKKNQSSMDKNEGNIL